MPFYDCSITDTIVSIDAAVSEDTLILSPVSNTSFWSPPTATSAPPLYTWACFTKKKLLFAEAVIPH